METTWERVLAWRMHRQFLADHDGPDATATARRLAGVQAQVPSSAAAAVALRRSGSVRGGDDGGVDAALADRTLVRTWAMRGTLHLLPVDVAPSYLAVLAAARTWEKGAWQREFATAERMAALATAVEPLLADTALTREELVEALDEPALASGWGALLKPLAWQGLVCHGTFDAWLLRGATPKKRLRTWFADLTDAGALTAVDVEGEPLHARTADLDALASAAPVTGVRLLPGFDQYVLGPGTADPRVVPGEHRGLVSRAAGWIAPVVVLGGRVVGTWAVDDDVLAVAPFPGEPAHDGLDEERERWSALVGRELTVRTVPV